MRPCVLTNFSQPALNLALGLEVLRQLKCVEYFSCIVVIRILDRHTFNRTWMWVIGTLTTCYLLAQIFIIIENRITYNKVVDQYTHSDTGVVYVDVWRHRIIPFSMYSWNYWEPNHNDDNSLIRTHFAYHYPGHGRLNILPSALEGKDNIRLGNQAIKDARLTTRWILIQDKQSPAKFIIHRKIFGIKEISPIEVDFSEINKETELWREKIIFDTWPYIVYTSVDIAE